jgi:valyl-tRNA synthetase
MTSALDELRFGEASSLIYNFLWGEFADWYLEISKARLRSEDPNIVRTTREVLLYVWDTSLKLLHPFMPYLTETLWQLLPQEGNSIMISEWPLLEDETDPHVDLVAIKTFSQFQSLVSAVRTARTENGVDVSKKIGFTLKASDTFCAQITAEVDVFCQLARVDKERFNTISMSNIVENSKSHIHIVVEEAIEGFIPLAGLVDSEKEVLRLEKQRQKLLKDLLLCEGRMSNKAFIERAPDSIVHEERQNLSRLKKQLSLVEACICKLKL